jgi:hypothetical protein
MNYKQIGDLGQNCVIGDLAKYGVGVAVLLSDNYPFDLIAVAGLKTFKVQVRASSQIQGNAVNFNLKKTNFYRGTEDVYTKEEVDIFALYNFVHHETYLLTFDECFEKKSIAIRRSKPKNNQSNYYDMNKYIISKERIKVVFGFDSPDFSHVFSSFKATQYDHVCLQCGKNFRNGSKNGKHCSVECARIAQRKVERPSPEKLKELISNNSFVALGKMFGVSDKAVKKWALKYGIF